MIEGVIGNEIYRLRKSVSELERENARLREALKDAREMLGDASRDEINLLDELEKWDRAYEHLLANDLDQRRGPASVGSYAKTRALARILCIDLFDQFLTIDGNPVD